MLPKCNREFRLRPLRGETRPEVAIVDVTPLKALDKLPERLEVTVYAPSLVEGGYEQVVAQIAAFSPGSGRGIQNGKLPQVIDGLGEVTFVIAQGYRKVEVDIELKVEQREPVEHHQLVIDWPPDGPVRISVSAWWVESPDDTVQP